MDQIPFSATEGVHEHNTLSKEIYNTISGKNVAAIAGNISKTNMAWFPYLRAIYQVISCSKYPDEPFHKCAVKAYNCLCWLR